MSKINWCIDEKGKIEGEFISTAVLVTELMEEYPKLSEMEVYLRLREIRRSAEFDVRMKREYLRVFQSIRNGKKE